MRSIKNRVFLILVTVLILSNSTLAFAEGEEVLSGDILGEESSENIIKLDGGDYNHGSRTNQDIKSQEIQLSLDNMGDNQILEIDLGGKELNLTEFDETITIDLKVGQEFTMKNGVIAGTDYEKESVFHILGNNKGLVKFIDIEFSYYRNTIIDIDGDGSQDKEHKIVLKDVKFSNTKLVGDNPLIKYDSNLIIDGSDGDLSFEDIKGMLIQDSHSYYNNDITFSDFKNLSIQNVLYTNGASIIWGDNIRIISEEISIIDNYFSRSLIHAEGELSINTDNLDIMRNFGDDIVNIFFGSELDIMAKIDINIVANIGVDYLSIFNGLEELNIACKNLNFIGNVWSSGGLIGTDRGKTNIEVEDNISFTSNYRFGRDSSIPLFLEAGSSELDRKKLIILGNIYGQNSNVIKYDLGNEEVLNPYERKKDFEDMIILGNQEGYYSYGNGYSSEDNEYSKSVLNMTNINNDCIAWPNMNSSSVNFVLNGGKIEFINNEIDSQLQLNLMNELKLIDFNRPNKNFLNIKSIFNDGKKLTDIKINGDSIGDDLEYFIKTINKEISYLFEIGRFDSSSYINKVKSYTDDYNGYSEEILDVGEYIDALNRSVGMDFKYLNRALEKSDASIEFIWEEEQLSIDRVTVSFDANGGKYQDGSIVKAKTIDKGARVEKISDNPRRSGYTFRGWREYSSNSEFNFSSRINSDLRLYAQWNKDSGGGGKDKPDPKPEPKPESKPEPSPESDKDRRGREIGKVIEPKIEFELNMEDHLAYLKGYRDDTIRPSGNLTREEAAMVFYRVMDKGFREEIETSNHKFSDIEAGRWSEKAIATLVNADMISGYGDGNFKPTKSITRAELSSMIAKLTDTIVLDTEFQDIIEHWAEDYINTAKNKGWIKGYEDGSFRPNNFISRSEFATVLNSILDRKTDRENMLDGRKTFKDLEETSWYYEMMMEAINGHRYKRESGREVWTELDNREFE